MDARRIQARDTALRKLRRLTTAGVAATGALALGVSFVAARAFPGRSSSHTIVRKTAPAVTHTTARPSQQPPPLVSAGSGAQPQTPPAPASPSPVPAAAPPVVVSGGS